MKKPSEFLLSGAAALLAVTNSVEWYLLYGVVYCIIVKVILPTDCDIHIKMFSFFNTNLDSVPHTMTPYKPVRPT